MAEETGLPIQGIGAAAAEVVRFITGIVATGTVPAGHAQAA